LRKDAVVLPSSSDEPLRARDVVRALGQMVATSGQERSASRSAMACRLTAEAIARRRRLRF
jgi:hypothetical protein